MKSASLVLLAFLVVSAFTFGLMATLGDNTGVTWIKNSGNPLIQDLVEPSVIYDGQMFKMWCSNFTGTYESGHPNYQICYAYSPNGIVWTIYGVVLDRGDVGQWDHHFVREPIVLFDGSVYRMWYLGQGDGTQKIGYANSTDGINWNKYPSPVLSVSNVGWDVREINNLAVIFNGTNFIMWYGASGSQGDCIGVATSYDGISWTKYSGNPVLVSEPSGWDKPHLFPGALFWNGTTYFMWYWGFNDQITQVGLATSPNGFSWQKYAGNPVLGPGPAGSWDSQVALSYSVLEKDNTLMMWYVGRSESTSKEGIGLATSSCAFHDIAASDISLSKTVLGQGYSANITAVITNLGSFTETFAVDFYANTTLVGKSTSVTLQPGGTASVVLVWNSAAYSKGLYTISAVAEAVPLEKDLSNNKIRDGVIRVTIPGDVDGDFKVGCKDLTMLLSSYGSSALGSANWNPNCDVNSDGKINCIDLVILICHYGQHYP